MTTAYLTRTEAAEYLRIKPNTMSKWASHPDKFEGPPYSKVGSVVLYKVSDLDEWVAATKRTSV